jgi:two-component system, OmpR family, alkaline phosphatase synthesis response regulator PhoP
VNEQKILIVDDEPDIVEFLKYTLEKENYKVIISYNGKDALEKVSEKPDLILLDIILPEINGFEFAQRIKLMQEYKNIPIIFLTAKSSEFDEVKAFEFGASDYIVKPISTIKLIARIRAALRDTGKANLNTSTSNEISVGPLVINRDSFTVKIDGQHVFFPKKEFQLLKYLVDNSNKVIGRDLLLKIIWGDIYQNTTRTVDVHIRKIRKRLGVHHNLIETIKGVGYKFVKPF